ncbi:MAG: sigma-70 family RNA polymerase sigma factor, partial [Acidobacteria bacterium]|nr:sigma-70 family RNA polymerase sigma factor [Acidobacteriota bacterium]
MDEAAFQAFYQKTAPSLWSYLCRVTASASLAEDLVQEAFCRLLKSPPPRTEERELRAYLYRIASNLAIDHWRRARRETQWEAGPSEVGARQDLDRRYDLTRTFHIGGTSSRIAEEAERRARSDGKVKYTDGLEWADVAVEFEDGTKGTNRVVLTREDESASDESKEGILVVDPKDPKRVLNRYPVPEGAMLAVKESDIVTKGDNERRATILYTWDPY